MILEIRNHQYPANQHLAQKPDLLSPPRKDFARLLSGSVIFLALMLTGRATPSLSWISLPPVSLTGGTTYPQSPQVTGTSSNGTLSAVKVDISVNGTWAAWAYAGGGNGFTSANMGNPFTPAAGSQYQFRAWAMESGGASTGYSYSPVYTVPGISWTSPLVAPLIKNLGYSQAGAASGTSATGNLTNVDVDLSQNGGSWTAWAYAAGGNGYTSANNGNPLTPSLGNQYQFRARARTSQNASSGYIYSPTYTVTNAGFKILIDCNQIGGSSTQITAETTSSNLSAIASDGVFSVVRPGNSPFIGSNWNSVFSNLQSGNGLVAETQYSDMAAGDFLEYNNATMFNNNVPPQYSLVYDESWARPSSEQFLGETLQLNELQQAAAWVGTGKVLVLTRAYINGGIYPALPPSSTYSSTTSYGGVIYPIANGSADLRGYYVDIALNSGYCGGLVLEVNPGDSGPRDTNVNNAAAATLAKSKKFYLLLPPQNAAVSNYLADIQATLRYLALTPSNLTSSNFTVVLAVYGRDQTRVGFLTGDNGVSTNSIASAVTFLKSLR